MKEIIDAVERDDLSALRSVLKADPSLAMKPQLILGVAGAANHQALELLERRGADWNARWRGYRPLHSLIQQRLHAADPPKPSEAHVRCLEFLLAHGADPEMDGAFPPASALIIAALTGVPRFVEVLIAHGAKRDAFGSAALGDLARVKTALTADRRLATARASGGLTALQCCAGSRLGKCDAKLRARLHEIATMLLDAGADPNARTKAWKDEVDVAYFALGAGDRAMVELLLDRGADPTAALPSAAWNGDLALADLVLSRGADLDRATSNGKPLLNDLIRWGQLTPALWALERGASPNVADSAGWTAVHQAVSRGNARMLEAVLARGGSIRVEDECGQTPVDLARGLKRAKMVDILKGGD